MSDEHRYGDHLVIASGAPDIDEVTVTVRSRFGQDIVTVTVSRDETGAVEISAWADDLETRVEMQLGGPTPVVIRVDQDHDAESPAAWFTDAAGARFYQRAANYENYLPEAQLRGHIKDAAARGDHVVLLDRYAHGAVLWHVEGEYHRDRFDTAVGAGVLTIPTATCASPEDARQFAAQFARAYTAWCNGDVYLIENTHTGETFGGVSADEDVRKILELPHDTPLVFTGPFSEVFQ